MKWIIGLLDFRLWANGWGFQQEPLETTGYWRPTGEGGQTWTPGAAPTGGFPKPAPAPAPAPVEDTGPDFAENRQVANIDRTSSYTHAQFARQIEGAGQQARASGADMPPQASDYELPDSAFGERLY